MAPWSRGRFKATFVLDQPALQGFVPGTTVKYQTTVAVLFIIPFFPDLLLILCNMCKWSMLLLMTSLMIWGWSPVDYTIVFHLQGRRRHTSYWWRMNLCLLGHKVQDMELRLFVGFYIETSYG